MSDTPIFERMVEERWPLVHADFTIADFPPVPERVAAMWSVMNGQGIPAWSASPLVVGES